MDKRMGKKIQSVNAVQVNGGGVLTPPRGVNPTIQQDWESRRWTKVAKKVDAGHTQVTAKADNKPSRLPVAKMKMYDQNITVQLKTQISAALDAIADAAYHIDGSQLNTKEGKLTRR